MNKFVKYIVTTLLLVLLFSLTACNFGNDETPAEDVLVQSGHSLEVSLPTFKTLNNNYCYSQEIQQTNGEDSFDFKLVKLDNNDIYLRHNYYNTNAGWTFREESLTDYDDLTDKNYSIYKKSDENFIEYKKFKYYNSDKEWQKFFYVNSESINVNKLANDLIYDFSFLNKADFDYDDKTLENGVIMPFWKIKSETLCNKDFKENFNQAMHINASDINKINFTFFFLYVENNQVTKIIFQYRNDNIINQNFKYTIEFDYDNFNFDKTNLTTGFTQYIPEN